MMSEMSIGGGRAPSVLTKEELTRHLLSLVLAAVLVWYTFVAVPVHARTFAAQTPDDEGRDGEVRGRDGGASAYLRADSTDTANEWFASGPTRAESARESVEDSARESVEELDWPEYIFVD